MPPLDPALGLSGALTAMQAQPPLTAAPNLRPLTSSGDSSAELSRAAKSLESVRGDVSGQTMAIQQMTTASQIQSANLLMVMSQLGNQISGLMSALNNLSSSMAMSGMGGMQTPVSPMMPPPPMDMGGGGLGGGQFGGMARTTGGLALRGGMAGFQGMQTMGGAVGGGAAAATLPFFGTPVHAPQAGTIAPRMSPDVGMMRAGIMATGMGITPEMMRTTGAGKIQEMGQERMQQRFGDVALGVGGGAAQLGTFLGGDAVGMGLAGGMGLKGLGGMAVGGLMGAGVGAIGGLAVDETMRQTAAMRGFGNQFARGAHRFLPASGMGFGQMRKPGMTQRLQVGKQMERMSIEDLTFNEQDIGEMFAGVTQQDLMRGVGSIDEVVTRFRETKETFKLIGRRMGQGLQEAAGTMGALQELGFDPTGQRGRAAIFGASSMQGLTPTEGMRRTTDITRGTGAVAGGYGQEMSGIAQTGIQTAQSAIQTGALDPTQVATLGGREGAQRVMTGMMEQFMNTGVGRAALLAGPGAVAGMDQNQILAAAANRAGQSKGRLMQLGMGGQSLKSEFLKDPRSIAMMYNTIKSQALIFKGDDPTIPMETAMQQAMVTGNYAANEVEAKAKLDLLRSAPEAIREQQRQQAREISDQSLTMALEEASPLAQAKRALKRGINRAAEPAADIVNQAEVAIGRAVTGAHRAILDVDVVSVGGRLDLGELSDIRERSAGRNKLGTALGGLTLSGYSNTKISKQRRAEQQAISKAQVSDATRTDMAKIVNSSYANITKKDEIDELVEKIRDPKLSTSVKNRLTTTLLDTLSKGAYSDARIEGVSDSERKRNLGIRRAIEESAIVTGVDVNAVRMGGQYFGGEISAAERETLSTQRGDIQKELTLDKPEQAMAFERQEIVDYLAALEADEGVNVAKERALGAGLKGEVAAIDRYAKEKEKATLHVGFGGMYIKQKEGVGGLRKQIQESMELGDKARTTDILREGVGSPLARTITGVRKRRGMKETEGLAGLTSNLESGGGGTMAMINQLMGALTPEDLEEMAKGGETEKQHARVFGRMQTIMDDEIIKGDELEQLAKLTGYDIRDKDFLDAVDRANKTGEIGALTATALAGSAPENLTATTVGGQLTKAQSQELNKMMTHNLALGEQVKEIALVVERIKPPS